MTYCSYITEYMTYCSYITEYMTYCSYITDCGYIRHTVVI